MAGRSHHDIPARGPQGSSIGGNRMIAAHRHDQIIALPLLAPLLGEIFLRVVDDMVRAKSGCLVHIPRTTHGRDLRSERLGDLQHKGSYASRGTLNQDLLSGPNVSFVSQSL